MPKDNDPKTDSPTPREPRGVLVLRTVAMPKDTNPNGDIFGGWIMSQMDMGGGLLAKEIAHGRVVTVTADKMTFVRPVKVGDTVCVYGEVLRVGRTSTDLRLETWAKASIEDFSRPRHVVTTGTFRFVAIDDDRRRPIPKDARYDIYREA